MVEIGERIAELKEGRLTDAQRRIAEYLAPSEGGRALGLTITELAREAGVSEKSVLQFCRKLGCKGYADFRVALAYEQNPGRARPEPGDPAFTETARAYLAALDAVRERLCDGQLKRACSLVLSARTVCCRGSVAAIGLKDGLLSLGIQAVCERDSRAANVFLGACREGDLLVSVGETEGAALRAASLARASGMNILSLASPAIEKEADCALSAAACDLPAIVPYLLIDILCRGIYRSDRARFRTFLARANLAAEED